MRPKGSAAELERRRRQAIELLEKGMTQAEVARAVGVADASVTRWKQAVEAKGADALAPKFHPGKLSRLTPAQQQKLIRLLLQGPTKHGFPTELWTLSRVVQVIEKNFGVQYHPSAVWHILRGLGWSCQKPERRARERDEQAIEGWRRKKWPNIKKRP